MLQSDGAKRYLARVRRALPYMGGRKRRLLGRIQEQLAIWEESCPSATYQNAVDRFGQPEQIAAAYVECADTKELLANMHFGGRVVKAVVALTVIVALIWGIGISIAVIDEKKSSVGYMTEVIEIIDRTEKPGAGETNQVVEGENAR